MTTGTTPEKQQGPPIRRWAADLLGLSANATPEQARAEFMRLLPREDFVPWLPQQLAFATLSGVPPLDARDLAWTAEEERWAEQVEEFAATLFENVPADRAQRWAELMDGCASFPRLKERLKQLEPALSVTMLGESAPPQARQLGLHLFELARLRPIARSVRRVELLRQTRSEESAWEETARWLQRTRPEIAALDKVFVDGLAQAKAIRHQEANRARQAQNQTRPAASAAPESSGFAGSWRFAWIGLVVVGALIRAAGTNTGSYNPPPPRFVVPTFPEIHPEFRPPQFDNLDPNVREMLRKMNENHDGPRPPLRGGGGTAKPIDPNDPYAPNRRAEPTERRPGITDRP